MRLTGPEGRTPHCTRFDIQPASYLSSEACQVAVGLKQRAGVSMRLEMWSYGSDGAQVFYSKK